MGAQKGASDLNKHGVFLNVSLWRKQAAEPRRGSRGPIGITWLKLSVCSFVVSIIDVSIVAVSMLVSAKVKAGGATAPVITGPVAWLSVLLSLLSQASSVFYCLTTLNSSDSLYLRRK